MTEKKLKPETLGAWVVHHGRKLQSDQRGPAEFSAIDGAAKGSLLLAGMASSDKADLSAKKVTALAQTASLNPKTELGYYLEMLRKRQLIDVTSSGAVSVLGVSSRKVLQESAAIFESMTPTTEERAAIDLAEEASATPRLQIHERKRLSEQFSMQLGDVDELLRRSVEIGFVDVEKDGAERLLFNGNLFRRDSVTRSKHVLDSLTASERDRIAQVTSLLAGSGCVDRNQVRKLLTDPLVYYASRRQSSRALVLVVEALRYRNDGQGQTYPVHLPRRRHGGCRGLRRRECVNVSREASTVRRPGSCG